MSEDDQKKKRAKTDHESTSVARLKTATGVKAGSVANDALESMLGAHLDKIVESARSLNVTTCQVRDVTFAIKQVGLAEFLSLGTKAVAKLKNSTKKEKGKSRSTQAGVSTSISWVESKLRTCAKNLSADSAVLVAGVLDGLMTKVMKKADSLKDKKQERITNREIQLALKELNMSGIVAHGGVMPFIHAELLPKKSQKEE